MFFKFIQQIAIISGETKFKIDFYHKRTLLEYHSSPSLLCFDNNKHLYVCNLSYKQKKQTQITKNTPIGTTKTKRRTRSNEISFFTNISHEFRTPLTLIITPLSVIINESENENLKGKLMSIYNNAQKLLALVNQLLDFRKLEVKGEKLI